MLDLAPAELLRVMLECAPGGLALFDRQMRYVAVNKAYRDHLCLGELRLLGQNHYEVFPEIPERWREQHRRGLAGESLSDEEDMFFRRSGRAEWYRWKITPWFLPNGEVGGISLFVANITPNIQARAEHALLFDAVQNSAFGLSVVEPDGIIRFANNAYARLKGEPLSKLVGRHVMTGFPLEVQTAMHRAADEADATGASEVEYQYTRPDGVPMAIRTAVTSVRDPVDGRVRYRVASTEDNSRRTEAEAQLRQAQKMETVGQFASTLAHDFNNFLTTIYINLELVRKQMSKDDAVAELLARAGGAVDSAASLTRQLLAFCRRQPLESTVLQPGKVLAELQPMIAVTVGRRVEMSYREEADIWPILADRSQFEAAILNLSLNARDAMPSGGRLTIRVRNCTFTEGDPERPHDLIAGHYVEIGIADSGVGMPTGVLQHIFEPFFTTKERTGGTGLGLSSVYGFVKQSAGGLAVKSQVGQGTEFRLYFPRTEAMGDEDSSMSAGESLQGSGRAN